MRGTYRGPDKRLRGKTAIVVKEVSLDQQGTAGSGESDLEFVRAFGQWVRVQFNDIQLREAFGWHSYPASYFDVEKEEEE